MYGEANMRILARLLFILSSISAATLGAVNVTGGFAPANDAFDKLVEFENIGTTNGANYSLYYGVDGSGANLNQDVLNEILIGSAYEVFTVNNDATGYNWIDPNTLFANLSGWEVNRALEADGSGNIVASAITATELNYLDGVTSAIQTQLDARCLESVFGTSISTGLLLDGTALKASAILQKYHAIDPSADVQTMLGSANNAAICSNIGLGTEDSPSFAGITVANTGLHILDTDSTHDLIIRPGSDLTADRTLTVTTGDADRTLIISGTTVLNQNVSTSGNPLFSSVYLNDYDLSNTLRLYYYENDTGNRTLSLGVNGADRTLDITGDSEIDQDVSMTGTPAFAGITVANGIDGIGAVDIDYGSADITDHTFTTDNGVTIIDGFITVPYNKGIVFKDSDGDTITVTMAEVTASRTLALAVNDGNRSLCFGGEISISGGSDLTIGTGASLNVQTAAVDLNQDLRTTDAPEFAGLSVETSTLYANSSQVGVGTASPTADYELDVRGDVAFKSTDTDDCAFYIYENPADGGSAVFRFVHSGGNGGYGSFYDDGGTVGVFIRGYGESYFNVGDVGIYNTTPDTALDVVGTVTCTKITAGTTDPKIVHYEYETRQSVIDLTKRDIPTSKLNGAVTFYNGETDQMELYFPDRGEFRDMMNNVLETVEPVTKTYASKTKYAFDKRSGEIVQRDVPAEEPMYQIKEGYELDKYTGIFYELKEVDDPNGCGTMKVKVKTTKSEAISLKGALPFTP